MTIPWQQTAASPPARDIVRRAFVPHGAGRRWLWLVVCSSVWLCGTVWSPAELQAGITVEEIQWGFDGTAIGNRFVPLSIQINNPSADSFDGVLRLNKTLGGLQSIDATWEEPIFVGPFSARWVQFYPLVGTSQESWRLSWDPGEVVSLPSPKVVGTRSVVLLDDPTKVSTSGGNIKRFPANLFPPFVTATDGLDQVFLDHVPRWEESRRQAFLDWLSLGGVVHLLPGTDGQLPRFSGPLEVLNQPVAVGRFGSGLVRRHDLSRSDLDRDTVERLTIREQPGNTSDELMDQELKNLQVYSNPTDLLLDGSGGVEGSTFLGLLRGQQRANHSWGLICLLALIYMGAVFPGIHAVGLKQKSFVVPLLSLLGLVGVFSLVFLYVGRRGYQEAAGLRWLAIARGLPDGRWDVAQWSDLFVTSSGNYQVDHAGAGRLYATSQQFEAVNGQIRSGSEGRFRISMPPFSQREFVHRLVRKGPDVSLRPLSEPTDGQSAVSGVEVDVPGPRPMVAYLIEQDSVYELDTSSNRWRVVRMVGPVRNILKLSEDYRQFPGVMRQSAGTGSDFAARVTAELHRMLRYALQTITVRQAYQFRLPPGVVRVVWLQQIQNDFLPQDPQLQTGVGYCLWVKDLVPGG